MGINYSRCQWVYGEKGGAEVVRGKRIFGPFGSKGRNTDYFVYFEDCEMVGNLRGFNNKLDTILSNDMEERSLQKVV